MNQNVADQINSVINNISGKLGDVANQIGVTLTQLFPTMVRMEIAKGVTNLIIALFLLTISLSVVFMFWKTLIKQDGHRNTYWLYHNSDGLFAILVVSGIIGVISAIVFPFILYQGIIHLVAPDYYAMQDIIEMAQSLIK